MANRGVLRSLCLMMWPAIFADNANGKRIRNGRQRANATSLAGGCAGAVGSAFGFGGSAFIRPGRRKLAGETLCEALTPPQPVASHATPAIIVQQPSFQSGNFIYQAL
jgi:hypothetical protein